jgi:hypothetical protein
LRNHREQEGVHKEGRLAREVSGIMNLQGAEFFNLRFYPLIPKNHGCPQSVSLGWKPVSKSTKVGLVGPF